MNKDKINLIIYSGCFENILTQSSPEIKEIAAELRQLVADVLPGVTEVVWEKQRIAGYGIGPKKMSEQFCYIAPMKNHVNFGFYYGADLYDPAHRLEGIGKNLRHVKIRSVTEVKHSELRELLNQASKYLPKLK